MESKKFVYNINFVENQWQLNTGAMEGYEQGNLVFIYPFNSILDEKVMPIEKLTLDSCEARISILSSSMKLDKREEYQALVYNTSYPLPIAFKGEDLAVENLQQAFNEELIVGELYYYDLLSEELDAKYVVIASLDADYMIYQQEEGEEKLLFTSKSALIVLKKLQFYAQWEQLLSTYNDNALNEMLNFSINYKGNVFNEKFLTIDDTTAVQTTKENAYLYLGRFFPKEYEIEEVKVSLLIFDLSQQKIYEKSAVSLKKFESYKGSIALYFTDEEIKNEIYSKEYLFKFYISEDSHGLSWSSQTIELTKLYAVPIETSKTESIELYKGVRIQAHAISLSIILMATETCLVVSKDFSPRYTAHPVVMKINNRDNQARNAVSENAPLIIERDESIDEYEIAPFFLDGGIWQPLFNLFSLNNGVEEYRITELPETSDDEDWITLGFRIV